jgi:hypothetical protein
MISGETTSYSLNHSASPQHKIIQVAIRVNGVKIGNLTLGKVGELESFV